MCEGIVRFRVNALPVKINYKRTPIPQDQLLVTGHPYMIESTKACMCVCVFFGLETGDFSLRLTRLMARGGAAKLYYPKKITFEKYFLSPKQKLSLSVTRELVPKHTPKYCKIDHYIMNYFY